MLEKHDTRPLEHNLNYVFNNTGLLKEALRHSSFVNEQGDPHLRDNECLEFLGDAVLNLIISHLLMLRFPDLKEGDLSRMRANLVNETQLAAIARGMELGRYIRLGKGEEQTHGREKSSILADTLEAVIAAIYLDGGFKSAFRIIESRFAALMKDTDINIVRQDYKSMLQEYVQGQKGAMPHYRIISEQGPDHDKIFRVELTLPELTTQGSGKSKKLAEQQAARNALEMLTMSDSPPNH